MTRTTSPFWVAATACAALFLVILDNTIVNVAIVPIAQALRADVHTLQWVIGAYFLAQAAVIPVTGYFAVRYGTKRVFLLALALFVLSSGLCGAASSAVELVVGRVLQGLGGGALYPLAQSIAFGAYSGQARIKGVSLTMVPGVLAPTLGPLSGGYLTMHYGWSSIFLINVPLGLGFLLLALWLLPTDGQPVTIARFDSAGLVACLVGVVALTYGFSLVGSPLQGSVDRLHPEGLPHGWTHPATLGCLGLGVVTLLGFVRHELRLLDPVLDLRLFLRREFRAAVAIASVNNAIFFGSMLILPFFLIHVRSPAMTSLDVGFALAPQGLGSALMLIVLPGLRRSFGQGTLVALGCALLGLSSWGIAHASSQSEISSLVPWIFVRGMGFGSAFQLTQAMAVSGLSRFELPRATSLFSVVRQISSSIGLALMISLFGDWSASKALALRLAEPTTAIEVLTMRAGYSAFEVLFHGLAAVSLVGIVLAFFLVAPASPSAELAQVPGPIAKPEALS